MRRLEIDKFQAEIRMGMYDRMSRTRRDIEKGQAVRWTYEEEQQAKQMLQLAMLDYVIKEVINDTK